VNKQFLIAQIGSTDMSWLAIISLIAAIWINNLSTKPPRKD
jgi:hypothetical protein